MASYDEYYSLPLKQRQAYELELPIQSELEDKEQDDDNEEKQVLHNPGTNKKRS